MRLVSIHNCESGMEIAKPIYTDRGTILVNSGVALTQRMIENMKNRNVSMVYIRDELTDDIDINDEISLEVRTSSTEVVMKTFSELQSDKSKLKTSVNHINVGRLQSAFKSLIDELRGSNNAINLLTSICAYDNYVFSHAINTTIYSLATAFQLNYDEKKLGELAMGCMLHDIGKTMIPFEILSKQNSLTTEEFDLMKRHTEHGYEILRKEHEISLLSAHCALQHHEKIDGTGYPRQLKGDEIHPYAKILSIADVFAALTSHRPYRRAMLPHEAMETLFVGTGTHFDQQLMNIFKTTVATYPVGVTVKLNSGETAVVIKYQFETPSRPIVRVIKDGFGKPVQHTWEVDLSKQLSTMIVSCDAIF